MTHGMPNSVDGVAAATGTAVGDGALPASAQPGELLDQVCSSALRLLTEAPCPPQRLRLRAGEVSLDIAWLESRVVAQHSAPTGTAPAPAPPASDPADPPEEAPPASHYLTAQTVGVFYRASEAGGAPFVNEGDTVVAGQQVGIIEVMKLMIPVESDRAGRITAVLKDDAEPVEYGDLLFALTLDPV